jgi:addiction module HigA family antidote
MAQTPIHPGEHLKEELEALNMSAAELARQLAVPTNRITAILNGRRAITGDTALRLSHFFGTSAEFWLNLQSLYDLRLAQKKAGKTIDRLPTLKNGGRSPSTGPPGTSERPSTPRRLPGRPSKPDRRPSWVL